MRYAAIRQDYSRNVVQGCSAIVLALAEQQQYSSFVTPSP